MQWPSSGESTFFVQELISRFSAQLHATPSLVAEAMETLRQHAVAKLASRRRFQETGVATLRVRLAGALPERVGVFVDFVEMNRVSYGRAWHIAYLVLDTCFL